MELNQESKVDCVLEWMNQFSDTLVEQMNDENESVTLTNITGTNLLDLNDYCLHDILSVNSLDLLDICSLAKTCKRFEQLTSRFIINERVAIRLREKDESSYGYVYEGWKWPFQPRKPKEVSRIFKQFGSMVSEICLISDAGNFCHEDRFTFELITKYCAADVLKNLYVSFQKIPELLTEKLRPIFNLLHCLYLTQVTIGDPALFTRLNSLIKLEVSFGENTGAILENIYPKLKSFSYKCHGVIGDTVGHESLENFVNFISRHKTLTVFELFIAECDNSWKDDIFQAIVNNCKELNELSIRMGTLPVESVRPLQSLKLLKDLTLRNFVCDDFEVFSVMKELRSLKLASCRLPFNAKQFVYLKHLTCLCIPWFSNLTIDVVGIVMQLQNLKLLELFDNGDGTKFHLDERKYSKIVDIVKDRCNVLDLYCEFNFKVTKCDDKLMVRLFQAKFESDF